MKTTAPLTQMSASVKSGPLRRCLFPVLAACLFGGAAAVIAVPSATAAPNPCAASEIARTIGSVSSNTGNYLDTHPDTNTALTSASQQPPQQALVSLKTYFDANPQAGKDLQTIQQPLAGLSGQCKLPISLPQALQFLQAAAPNGGLPAGLPGGVGTSPAGAVGTPPASGVGTSAASGVGTPPAGASLSGSVSQSATQVSAPYAAEQPAAGASPVPATTTTAPTTTSAGH